LTLAKFQIFEGLLIIFKNNSKTTSALKLNARPEINASAETWNDDDDDDDDDNNNNNTTIYNAYKWGSSHYKGS